MRHFIFIFLLVFTTAFAYGQESTYSSTNSDALFFFNLANKSLQDHLYKEAVLQFKKAIRYDDNFIEAYIQLGDLYRLLKQHPLAIKQYARAIEINPEFNKTIYYKVGDEEFDNANYENALKYFQKYLSYPETNVKVALNVQKLVNDCKFSIDAIKNPVPFQAFNLGPNINTPDDEYLPVTTADDSTLILTRRINNNEDFYESVKVGGQWQEATYLSDRINTPEFNEGAQSISKDGKYLFFTGCNRPDGMGRCDIYLSQKKKDNSWGRPIDLPSPINTSGWEAQPSISSDGRTLYFVSNREGGYGGYDIWKSTLTEKGWGPAENLGPNINTAYDEQSPFIHADDSTLYFCSKGWPGLGGFDLFVSKLGKDGKWQKPENMGYPINTSGDESGLSVSADGSKAYFSSNKLDGYGGYDIYYFELPVNKRPHGVTYVKGLVFDSKTNLPLEAAVEIIDLDNNNPVYQDYSDLTSGEFMATLVKGKNYALNISIPGYLLYSENFSLEGYDDKKPFHIKINLQPIETGFKVILRNVFFDTNKFDLKKASEVELDKLVEYLTFNAKLHILITGHTDSVGTPESNQILSENRAKAVYQYLINHKISASRLSFKGYGETRPIADNGTEEGRQTNRRTEFEVVSK